MHIHCEHPGYLLAITEADRWRPGIGDPTFMGWFTVFAYAVAALLCYRAFRVQAGSERRSRKMWMWLTVQFAALAINKQLDLQSLFTQIGRDLARQGDWYGSRHVVQFAFITGLAALALFAVGYLVWKMRHSLRANGLAIAGTVFIIAFVVIRAASFHHFDEFLGWDIFGFEMNWALELGGISCVAIGAARNAKTAAEAPTRVQVRRASRPLQPPLAPNGVVMNQRESFRWMVERLRTRQ